MLYSRAAAIPVPATTKDRATKLSDSFIYNMVDKFYGLKRAEERTPAQSEESDAMLAQELYSGTVRAKTEDFHDDMKDPLIKAIHAEGLEYDEVEEFLWAKRAYWYNKVMRERNPARWVAGRLKAWPSVMPRKKRKMLYRKFAPRTCGQAFA